MSSGQLSYVLSFSSSSHMDSMKLMFSSSECVFATFSSNLAMIMDLQYLNTANSFRIKDIHFNNACITLSQR